VYRTRLPGFGKNERTGQSAFLTVRVTMLRTLFLIACGPCVLLARGTAAAAAAEKMDVYRLPNDTEPLSYRLNVGPVVGDGDGPFTFSGNVAINVRARTSTAVLTLNADAGLTVSSVEVIDAETSTKVEVTGSDAADKNEQLKIRLGDPGLIAGREYEVKIAYSGYLRDDMTGFYKSSYVDRKTNTNKCVHNNIVHLYIMRVV